jgi:hypothetical protein
MLETLSTECDNYLVGGFKHLEKYESQWEGLSHVWKIKHVRNYQPATIDNGNGFLSCRQRLR